MKASPLVTDQDVGAVAMQMRSMWIGRGSRVAELESRMARWVGAKYGVCLGSGTAALIVALRLLKAGGATFPTVCDSLEIAAKAGCIREYGPSIKIAIYPETAGEIIDYARHLPKKYETKLTARFGVFSFGALKDISGGIGGCLVSNDPIDAEDWKKISPLSDINAAMILSQLSRYEGKADYRLVADNKLWRLKETPDHHPV